MADDIRLFVGFPDHPKTIKLIRRAGEGSVRCLLRLWLWSRVNRATTGDLEGLEDEDIEIAAGWTGDDGVFVAALRTCRFLDGHRLHGWEERQEHAVEEDARSDRAALSAYRRYHSEEEAQALLTKRKEKRSQCGRSANALRPACSPPSPPSPPSVEEEEPNGSLSGSEETAPDAAAQNGVPYTKIVQLLNECAGTRFKPNTPETKRLIKARWNAGFREEDFEQVIRKKCSAWKTDPNMVSYLRPQTLFGTKFEAYLNEHEAEQEDHDELEWI